ncbi:acetate kinase [Candidatus Nitrosoglobus terrae]|uniref:Acetate kinase n=2 Tax=Candidatus Nitrosoglobus terrae TaxID=1630141 RepID=A0A1Q2SNK0_9GAMM|nr:acetate kinase [Candidatus Nitrosoglobus terrae]
MFSETGTAPYNIVLDSEHPHTAALALIQARISAYLNGCPIAFIAHRIVHGGSKYFNPMVVNSSIIAELRTLIPLAPLHQAFPLTAMSLLLEQQPNAVQVACFDTAFHHTLPKVEQIFPLPYSAWERGLRRYGFHGLSYNYISHVLPERHGNLAHSRVIVAHLGNGASLCAMNNRQSIATTMGFSTLDGLMMGTRSGGLDPGVMIYLMETEKLTLKEIEHILYYESGLLGVSGISAEPQIIVQHENDPSEQGERARLALALYIRRIVREIGALTAVLGGLDLLVFTAGIGEHNAFVRERICRELVWLGVKFDLNANANNTAIISTPSSQVRVAVEPTNEEWIIAHHTQELMAIS